MTPGEVLFHPSKEHPDGATSPKLLIVLNQQRNGIHLLVYTTSQPRDGWRAVEGCDPMQELYHIVASKKGFTKPTWVQLWRVEEWDVRQLEEQINANRLKAMSIGIPPVQLRAIANCYRKTESFTKYHGWLLEE